MNLGTKFIVGTLVAAAISLGGFTIASSEPDQGRPVARPEKGGMPRDVNGDGVISDKGEEQFPKLILAQTDDGKEGYLRLEEVMNASPKTPNEAAARQGQVRRLAVYADDGVTRIGWLTAR